mmetsp:Transcript_13476/g.43015  ORF Transcript_13476/g.43015 Transcript_13476/m.43015 type:complete len:256 (+) Transcript_13476:113-880(+)
MHPSFSGWLVTCAYLPHTTLPVVVTSPRSLTLTSMTVPLVMTPSCVYSCDCGFFLTPMMSRQKVVLSSGCVTWARLKRRPEGRMKRSYLGGLRVNESPTNVTLVTMRFQAFCFFLPVRITLNISASDTAPTLGMGTSHLPAFSFRFCFTVLLSTLARDTPSRSSRYAGTAPSGTFSSSACLLFRCWCKLMVFFMAAFSLYRCCWYSLARRPCTRWANWERRCASRASFLRCRSKWSRRKPCRFWCSSMCSFWGIG